MRVVVLIRLLLLVVVASLAPAGAAHAHAGHAGATAADARAATGRSVQPVLQSGSHCPSDSGHCCCETDRCAGSRPSRSAALAPPPTVRSPEPVSAAIRVRATLPIEVHDAGAPATTRLARAPPDLP